MILTRSQAPPKPVFRGLEQGPGVKKQSEKLQAVLFLGAPKVADLPPKSYLRLLHEYALSLQAQRRAFVFSLAACVQRDPHVLPMEP